MSLQGVKIEGCKGDQIRQLAALLTVNGKGPETLTEIVNAVASALRAAREFGTIIHDMTVANQAAWIEWKHGDGAEAAMRWIENGLAGPGMLPGECEDDIDADDPILKDAQGYYDCYSSWQQAKPLDSKIAALRREAKHDTELLNFVDSTHAMIRHIEVLGDDGKRTGAAVEVAIPTDGDWGVIQRGKSVREALQAAVRATDPQGDLFAVEQKAGSQ